MAQMQIGGKDGIKVRYEETTPEKIADTINKLGVVPNKVVPAAVRKSAATTSKLAKRYAPEDTGWLKEGIGVLRKERTSTAGKVVFDVAPRASAKAGRETVDLNKIFQKTPGTGKKAYYPASQEYGFDLIVSRAKVFVRHIEGKHYLLRAAEDVAPVHKQLVLSTLGKKLDAEFKKK